MYRSFRQLREGWTKNLALLFPNPARLAVRRLLWWGIAWGIVFFPPIALAAAKVAERFGFVSTAQTLFHGSGFIRSAWWGPVLLVLAMPLVMRLKRANFTWDMEVLGALFGMPMFSYLLLRSKKAQTRGQVSWKGRDYSVSATRASTPAETQARKPNPRIENPKLRTEN